MANTYNDWIEQRNYRLEKERLEKERERLVLSDPLTFSRWHEQAQEQVEEEMGTRICIWCGEEQESVEALEVHEAECE